MQPNDKKAEGTKIVMTLKNRSYIKRANFIIQTPWFQRTQTADPGVALQLYSSRDSLPNSFQLRSAVQLTAKTD